MKRFLLLLLLTLSMFLMFACSPNGSVNGDGEEGINDELLNNDPLDKEPGSEEGNTEILPPRIDVSTNEKYSVIVQTESEITLERMLSSVHKLDRKVTSAVCVSIDPEPVECGDDSITLRVYYGFDRSIAEQYDLTKWYSAHLKVYNESKESIFTHTIYDLYEDEDNFIDVKDRIGYVTNDIFKKYVDVEIPFKYFIDYSNKHPAHSVYFELTMTPDGGETFEDTHQIYYKTTTQPTTADGDKMTIKLYEYTKKAEEKIVELLRLKYMYLWPEYAPDQKFVNFEEPPTITGSDKEIVVSSSLASSIEIFKEVGYREGWVLLELTGGSFITDEVHFESTFTSIPTIYTVEGDSIDFVYHFAFLESTLKQYEKNGAKFKFVIERFVYHEENTLQTVATINIDDIYTNKNYVLSGEPRGDGCYVFEPFNYSEAKILSFPLEWLTYEPNEESKLGTTNNWGVFRVWLVAEYDDGTRAKMPEVRFSYIKRGESYYILMNELYIGEDAEN